MRSEKMGGKIVTIHRTILVGILFGLVVSFAMVSTGLAQTGTQEVEVTWTQPTVGTEPVMYHLWVRSKEDGAEKFGEWEKGESTPNLSQILTYKTGFCYEVRVQAEDKDGNIGPFSIPSLEYCGITIDQDSGPGQPGKPSRNN